MANSSTIAPSTGQATRSWTRGDRAPPDGKAAGAQSFAKDGVMVTAIIATAANAIRILFRLIDIMVSVDCLLQRGRFSKTSFATGIAEKTFGQPT